VALWATEQPLLGATTVAAGVDGQTSVPSRTPSLSSSLSHRSPWLSPSMFSWSLLATTGQLSALSGRLSLLSRPILDR
jgi:hypothetical protein